MCVTSVTTKNQYQLNKALNFLLSLQTIKPFLQKFSDLLYTLSFELKLKVEAIRTGEKQIVYVFYPYYYCQQFIFSYIIRIID